MVDTVRQEIGEKHLITLCNTGKGEKEWGPSKLTKLTPAAGTPQSHQSRVCHQGTVCKYDGIS